jgi:hypothetical protein
MISWNVTALVLNDVMDCDDFGTQWYHGLWRLWHSMMSWIVTTLILNYIMDCDYFGTQWYYGLRRHWYSVMSWIETTLVDLKGRLYLLALGFWLVLSEHWECYRNHRDSTEAEINKSKYYYMISWIVTTLVLNDIMDCDDLDVHSLTSIVILWFILIYTTHILFNELSKYMSYLNSK